MFLKNLPLHISRKLQAIPFIHDFFRDLYCLFRPGIRATVCKTFKTSSQICFLKIGANDGVSGDPLAEILLGDSRYRGVLVEPLPLFAKQLKQVYHNESRFQIVEAAITDSDGEIDIYFFDESKLTHSKFPAWYGEIASLDKQHLTNHLPAQFHDVISAKSVLALSVSTLLQQAGITSLNLLHIDTEGHDFCILRQFDLKKHRPEIIIAEHKHLNANDKFAMTSYLQGAGYTVRELEADFLATL
jgi:FkbM family methyltransferase